MAGKLKNKMETSAVYWEPKIKTYGFHEVYDLTMLEATIRQDRIAQFGSFLGNLGVPEINFHLILMQILKDQAIDCCIIFDRKWEEKIQQSCNSIIRKESEESFLLQSPVELIYFFGPHFGERYGIADTTFQVLAENNLPVLAAGFSGSAVYLVLPDNGIKKVGPVFSSAFEVPKSK
jgi:aspartokinase